MHCVHYNDIYICCVQMTMDDFHKMHDDLERVIEKDDTSSTITGSDCEETLRHGPHTLRQKLDIIVHSHKFQVGL